MSDLVVSVESHGRKMTQRRKRIGQIAERNALLRWLSALQENFEEVRQEYRDECAYYEEKIAETKQKLKELE